MLDEAHQRTGQTSRAGCDNTTNRTATERTASLYPSPARLDSDHKESGFKTPRRASRLALFVSRYDAKEATPSFNPKKRAFPPVDLSLQTVGMQLVL